MRKWIAWVLIALMVFTLAGCKNNEGGEDLPDDTGGGEVTNVHRTDLTPEGRAWRDKVTSSPIIAEIEHKGTIYTVHALDALRYIYNTETTEIITGAPVSNAKATVLKDWISPYGSAALQESDALFDCTWEYTSTRARALIGYCNEAYDLVTKARTADYLEYIYKEKNDDTHYRVAITDDYILFAPLLFDYVFDVIAY